MVKIKATVLQQKTYPCGHKAIKLQILALKFGLVLDSTKNIHKFEKMTFYVKQIREDDFKSLKMSNACMCKWGCVVCTNKMNA